MARCEPVSLDIFKVKAHGCGGGDRPRWLRAPLVDRKCSDIFFKEIGGHVALSLHAMLSCGWEQHTWIGLADLLFFRGAELR